MKVLILGSTGVLGNNIKKFLQNKKIKLSYITRNKSLKSQIYLKDFTNFKKLGFLIKQINPDYIINCIGVTKFHNDYEIKKITKLINTKLPIFLSKLCLKRKIYFLHISTDCVFFGDKGNYVDTAKKDAKDLYGLSKNYGEVKNKFSTTIRTSFIGPELNSHKSLLNWFLNQKNKINGFSNAYFSGLTSLELSKLIYKYFLKRNDLYNQVINIGGKKISKYNLLIIISKVFKKKIFILKYTKFKIDRSLDSSKFRKLSGYKLPKWIDLINDLKSFMNKNKYKY